MKLCRFSIKELFRFLVGGGSAVIVDYIAYRSLMLLGWDRNISKAVSFALGSIVGFLINKFWTFESKKFLRSEIFKYIVLYSVTAMVNAFVNAVLLYWIGSQIWAFLCATGVSTILNFLGQKFFVFAIKS